MITIQNPNGVVLTHFDNNSPEGNPYFEPTMTENIESLVSGFSFSVPLELSDSQYLKGLNKVLAKDKDGDLRLFTIVDTYEEFQEVQSVITVEAEDVSITEMNDSIVTPYNAHGIKEALTGAFVNSGWQVSFSSDSWSNGNQDISFILSEPENMRSVVNKIRELYDLEFKFIVERDNFGQLIRVVKVYKNRGVRTGKYFTYDRDVLGITRQIDYSVIKTAIYPYLVNNGVITDLAGFTPINKIKGFTKDRDSPFIINNDAHANFDTPKHYKIMTFKGDTGAERELLYRAACAELLNYVVAKYTYTVNVLLLSNMEGWDGEDVNLGDTVWIKERVGETEIGLEARVIQYVYHEDDPSSDEVTFSNFVEIDTTDSADIEGIRKALNDLKGTVDGNSSMLEGFEEQIAGLTQGQAGIIKDLNGKNSISIGDTPIANPIQGDTWFTVEVNEKGQDIHVIKVYNTTTKKWEPRMDTSKAFEAADTAEAAQKDAETSLEAANKAVEEAEGAKTIAETNAAKIVLMDEAINLRVEKDDVINQINVSSEGIIISGAKVQITGSTYIEDAVIKDAMIDTITASKLTAGIIDASIINVTNINASELKAGTIQGINIVGSKFTNPFSVINAGTILTGNTLIEGANVKISYDIGDTGRTGSTRMHPLGFDTRVIAADGKAESYVELTSSGLSMQNINGEGGTISAENLMKSPWYTLPLYGGWQTSEGNTPQYQFTKRLDGAFEVKFRGQIERVSGDIPANASQTYGSLSVGLRPPKNVFIQAAASTFTGVRLGVLTQGDLRINAPVATKYVVLDQVSYIL